MGGAGTIKRDKETEVEVDHSGMENASVIGGYTRLALKAFRPYALHLGRDREQFLWWVERPNSPGNTTGMRYRKPVDPWVCFSQFCALHDATDETIFKYAERYGILGIWPTRRQFCVTNLDFSVRQELSIWNTRRLDGEPYTYQTTEERSANPEVFRYENNFTWYGEPVGLWRRLSKHLRALVQIAAILHRNELVPDSIWGEVLLPEEIDVARSEDDGSGKFRRLPPMETQREELADLINRWLPNVAARLYFHQMPREKPSVQLMANWFEISWTDRDYEECEVRGYAHADLRSLSGWNRDGLGDLTTRPSLLLNILILQLTAMIASDAAICPRCGNPALPYGPSGKRLPFPKTYCGETCKAEARKETKRNSWHKSKRSLTSKT